MDPEKSGSATKRGCTADEYTIKTNERVRSMSPQNKLKLQRRRSRKFFWLFAGAAVCALLFAEQVALFYVPSTLAMCGLLIAVAFSNLEVKDAEMWAAARGAGVPGQY